jgi:hypothetical protein
VFALIMARIGLRSHTNGSSAGVKNGGGEREQPTVSTELAGAKTAEERRDVFVKRLGLEGEPAGQFEADCEKVGDLLERNDLGGLLKHGGRSTRERAEARAAAIRSGR